MSNENRVPPGSPEGGQFAPGQNSETEGVSLSTADTRTPDEITRDALGILQEDMRQPNSPHLLAKIEPVLIPGAENPRWASSSENCSPDEALAKLRAAQESSDSSKHNEAHADTTVDAGMFYGGPDTEPPTPEVRSAMLDLVYQGQDGEHRAETERLMDISERMSVGPEHHHDPELTNELYDEARERALEYDPEESEYGHWDKWDGAHWGMNQMIGDRLVEQAKRQRERRLTTRQPQ